MRPEVLAIVPGILAIWFTFSRSVGWAFLSIYLPVLILIPDHLRLPIDGLPDPTFSTAAILPIGVVVCWRAVFNGQWRWSWLDLVMGAFLGWELASDFQNVGLIDAQNLAFDLVTMALFPYVCGKSLLEPLSMRLAFARRFVWLVFVVSIVSFYEFRMSYSLFRPLLASFFPGQGSEWFTQSRWAFGRIAGPFGHAILMGAIVATAVLLCLWLSRSGLWERDFRFLGNVHFTKQQMLMTGLVIALAMTLSRGPWLGVVCGAILSSAASGWSLRSALIKRFTLIALLGVAVYVGGRLYLESQPQPGDEITKGTSRVEISEVTQSSAYRAELFDKYFEIVMQRPVWGWGRANWPVVHGMSSIDNNYLFIALNSGLVGVGAFVMLLAAACFRLARAAATITEMPVERSLLLTQMGVIVAIAITTLWVFMGSQLYPLCFLFVGWSEGCASEQLARQKVLKEVPVKSVPAESLAWI